MKKFLPIVLVIFSMTSSAQVINLVPQANAIQLTTNTSVSPGTPGIKTYIVCPGVTLTYSESSTMDTIILRGGSTLIFDSTFSYGYARVYA